MEIGAHCSQYSCKRLDFLPFTCEQCQKLYCKDHRLPEQHECKPSSQGNHEAKNELRSFVCSLPGCKRREVMEVSCPRCEETFCLQHRHQVDHNCPVLPKQPRQTSKGPGRTPAEKKSAVEQTKTWSPAKVSRLDSTRSKVLMMKLKMKAEGSDAIPLNERVYYNVQLPNGEGVPSKPMFFSHEWSVGKTVDFIAHRHKIRNENNKTCPERILVLYGVTGEAVEMSRPLKSYLDYSLPSGGSIVLKYECP